MQALRNAHLIARFVLVWFALSIGVALASPIVNPQPSVLICSAAGVMKQLVQTDDGTQQLPRYTLDCPLCVMNAAPPLSMACLGAEPAQPLAYVLHSLLATHVARLTTAPLPARGPPATS